MLRMKGRGIELGKEKTKTRNGSMCFDRGWGQ
jgi:hypothetical protein